MLIFEVVMSKAYPKEKYFKNLICINAAIASVFLQETPNSSRLENSNIKFKSIDGGAYPTNLSSPEGITLNTSVLNLAYRDTDKDIILSF